jgi:hypothetical protein
MHRIQYVYCGLLPVAPMLRLVVVSGTIVTEISVAGVYSYQ